MDRSKLTWAGAGGALGALAAWMLLSPPGPPDAAPVPPPAKPLVKPAGPEPKPKRPRWEAAPAPAVAGPSAGDAEPAVDLLAMPQQLRPRNIASKGLGCCTFRSAEYLARWQEVPQLYGLPEWMRDHGIAGGGTPSKQADMVARISADRGMPAPAFVQYEGRDPSFIELALKTGRPVGITWQANHMLVCVHLDAQVGMIVDNNDPHRVQVFPRATFLSKWTAGGGGWCFVLLASPPPPPPAGRPKQALQPCGRASCDCGCRDGEACRCAAAAGCDCSPGCSCGCNDGRPCACGPPPAAGLEWHYEGRERYTFGPSMRELGRAQVEAALADDSARPHLTVIGPEQERALALAPLGDLSARYHVQGYAADHWAVQCGFARPAAGVVCYLQRPDGTVAARVDSAARLAEALRRADPAYDPRNDPTGGPAAAVDWLRPYAPWLLGGAGLLAAGWLLSRSKGGDAAAPAPATQPARPTADELFLRLVTALEQRQAQAQAK